MSTLVKDSNGEWKQAAGNYSVWQGTRAELEAALSGGTIPNGTVAIVTDDYAMQGVSCVPDWGHAVDVTATQVYAGYTCPDNGLFLSKQTISSIGWTYLYINDVPISYTGTGSGNINYTLGVQCPVAKDNVVSSSSQYSCDFTFVPWKK